VKPTAVKIRRQVIEVKKKGDKYVKGKECLGVLGGSSGRSGVFAGVPAQSDILRFIGNDEHNRQGVQPYRVGFGRALRLGHSAAAHYRMESRVYRMLCGDTDMRRFTVLYLGKRKTREGVC
jgi:hypothetical protein